jgi:hypothetical protein
LILTLQASGSLASGVDFVVKDARGIQQQTEVLDLMVEVRQANGGWKTIWSIDGRERLGTIVYGREYAGLRTLVRAEPLKVGEVYLATAHVRKGLSYSQGLPTIFRVSEGGKVIDTNGNSRR